MSRFGNSFGNSMMHGNPFNNQRFSHNPFHKEIFQTNQSKWDLVRNNIDSIIQKSKIPKEEEETKTEEEAKTEIELFIKDTSKCNELPVIYECENTPTNIVKTDVIEELKIEQERPIVVVEEVKKKRLDFASVVFKYRNKLARQKHKELAEGV